MYSTHKRFGILWMGVLCFLGVCAYGGSAYAKEPKDRGYIDIKIDFTPNYDAISSPWMRDGIGAINMGVRGSAGFGALLTKRFRAGVGIASGWSLLWSQGLANENNTSVTFAGELTTIEFQMEFKSVTPWRFLVVGADFSWGGGYLSGVWHHEENGYNNEVGGWGMSARIAGVAELSLREDLLLRVGIFGSLNDFTEKKELRAEPPPEGVTFMYVNGLVVGVTWRSML